MEYETNKEPHQHPSETKLFHGVQYWVSVPADSSTFVIVIGHGELAINEAINCPDVSAENYQELYRRGHAHAQKIIQTNSAELNKRFGCPPSEDEYGIGAM